MVKLPLVSLWNKRAMVDYFAKLMVKLPLVSLWNEREMVFYFAKLNIKHRFKGTYFGLLWTALEPALVFILLYTVFTSIRFRAGEDFPIYLLTSIILYHIFTRGTIAGASSIRSNKGMIQSIKINNEFFPVVATAATGLLVFIQVGVFFALLPFFQFIPTSTIIFLPIVLLLLLVLTLGVSYILSILSVFIRDIQPIWGIIIHALFFITPVLWYLEDASEFLLMIHRFNPVGQILELGHNIVVFGKIPPLYDWIYASLFVIIIFFIGFGLFQKFESKIAEEL